MNIESWKIEFDEKFGVKLVEWSVWSVYGKEQDWRNYSHCEIREQGVDKFTLNNIKSFIENLLSKELQKEKERVAEKIKKEMIDWRWVDVSKNYDEKPIIGCDTCDRLRFGPETSHICENKNDILEEVLNIIK